MTTARSIARVFPRRTKATPDDALAFVGMPPKSLPQVDEVHVSVAFEYDLPRAEQIAEKWSKVAPVRMGGPAFMQPGQDFVPGRYIKHGYTITSRGCPNACWFCSVPKRDGRKVRELTIHEGWNVLDDNILACSEKHIRAVFGMLGRQSHYTEFTGGLEAARLKPWHVDLLATLKPKRMYFAYDTPNDLEPLQEAGKLLLGAGISARSHCLCCYVLIGYPGDTFEAAERRLWTVLCFGFTPAAMLFRDKQGKVSKEWRRFQREWFRPEIIYTKMKNL